MNARLIVIELARGIWTGILAVVLVVLVVGVPVALSWGGRAAASVDCSP